MGRPRSCECGTCPKCRERARSAERWAAYSDEERRAIVQRRDRAKRRAANRRHDAKRAGSVKTRARKALTNAIRDGRIVRGSCERLGDECRGNVHAHHDDYSRPLDVRWLCEAHHIALHREEAERARTQAA